MATTRSFQDMLNEYLPNDLFKDELLQRDWYLQNIQKDNNWKGGDIIVPFQAASASSMKFGGLTSESDISEFDYVRGKIQGYKEVWGSLVFNETDIMQHDGRVNEQSFLRVLPDQIEEFMNYMKMATSINLLTGPHFAKITDVTNAATGVLVVDKVDRFELGMKLVVSDNSGTAEHFEELYVIAIEVDAAKVTLSLTRGGAFADLSGAGAAFNGVGVSTSYKMYHDGICVAGVATNHFNSLRSSLLSAANGGAASIHGQTKLSAPALQAVNVSGASISATNILDKLFDAWTTIKIKAKAANPGKCVMSLKHLGSVMKAIEAGGGIHQTMAKNPKITKFGWTEVEVMGVKGAFTIVGIQEMDDDIIAFLDMTAMTFRTNGYFMKKKSPEGLEYYRIRGASGYKLICDVCLFGEQEVRKPATCGIIHSISY